jgi:hypothetical protein
MAHTYHISDDEPLAHLTFTGTVTGPGLVHALTDLYADPAWRGGYNTIWDFRAIRQLLLEEKDFKALIGLDFAFMHHAGDGCDAIVVARDLDRFMARLFLHHTRHAPRRTALFDTLEEARRWLGLPVRTRTYRAAA